MLGPRHEAEGEGADVAAAGYAHSDIGRTTSVRFVSHQVVEYKM
jgi:hypothetical protein